MAGEGVEGREPAGLRVQVLLEGGERLVVHAHDRIDRRLLLVAHRRKHHLRVLSRACEPRVHPLLTRLLPEPAAAAAAAAALLDHCHVRLLLLQGVGEQADPDLRRRLLRRLLRRLCLRLRRRRLRLRQHRERAAHVHMRHTHPHGTALGATVHTATL